MPIILLLFSNIQATWSDGKQMENKRKRKALSLCFAVFADFAEWLLVKEAKI